MTEASRRASVSALFAGLVAFSVIGAGCSGDSSGENAEATSTTSAQSSRTPESAEEFWTLLRAAAAAMGEQASDSGFDDAAWTTACEDMKVLAEAVKNDHETFLLETGDRLTVMQIGATCERSDSTSRRAISVKFPELLSRDPFHDQL